LLAPHPTPTLEDHLFSALCDYYSIYSQLDLEGVSSSSNLRTRHAVVTRDLPNIGHENIRKINSKVKERTVLVQNSVYTKWWRSRSVSVSRFGKTKSELFLRKLIFCCCLLVQAA
jgi:hypothetical protein